MATTTKSKKNTVSTDSSQQKKQPTAAELQEWYQKHNKSIEKFERMQEALKLLDPTKSTTRTFNTFSKENLRTYMQNPLAQYRNLRNLSRYLYYRSQVYRRIINYNASMIDLNYRSVIPKVNLADGVDNDEILESYYSTLSALDKMNLPLVFLPIYTTCWVEDIFYGCVYSDDTGFYVLHLNPDYCQVTSIYPTGDLGFDFDCSYFRNHADELEMWGEPFTSMYEEYQRDTVNNRWQPMPDENCICLKINLEEMTVPTPPYITLFNHLINLEDLNEITAIADEQQIYKLLVATIPTLKNSDNPDDFSIDPQTAIDYFNRMLDTLPDYTDAVLSPIPIDSITFDQDQASDVNKVENAAKNILTSSGHTILANPSGTTAMYASLQADEDYAISSLLPQTEAWLNRFLMLKLSNPSKVKLLEVTKFTKDKYKDSIIKDLNYGSPLITTLGVLNGYSELDQISMAHLNDALGIRDLFRPMATAATRSAEESEPGRPKGDATDESEDSEDKRESAG